MKLTISQRLQALKSGLMAATTGVWEGYERTRLRQRGPRKLESQDDSLDMGTRESLMSEARQLCQVFPVTKRILRKYANYVVGDCRYKWSTGDDAINAAYRDYWYSWMDRADANGVHRLPTLSRLVVMSALRDGDCFASLTPGGVGGMDLMVRLIEADRVGNYQNGSINIDDKFDNGTQVIGGVIQTSQGRPIAYRVNERNKYGQFKNAMDVPAANMRHVFDPDRIDAARGVTSFHNVLNTLRDLKEIVDANKANVKLNSKLALLVKTMQGAAVSGSGGLDLFSSNDGTESTSTNVNRQEIGDAAVAYMFPNEEMKAHKGEMPSGEVQEFMRFMIHQIAIGMDLPMGVVWTMSGLTGPGVRYDINDADRTFQHSMDILEEKFLDPIVGRVISNGIARGHIPNHPNWYKFERQRPASITIDLGRESSAMINENTAWLRSGSDSFAEAGKDHDEEITRIANERAKRYKAAKDAAAMHGVPIEYILGESANIPIKQEAPKGKPMDDDEDEDESDNNKPEDDEDESPAS